MEQEKQNHSYYTDEPAQKKERQVKRKKNKKEELQITFHNPNTELETAHFLARLILNHLEEPE